MSVNNLLYILLVIFLNLRCDQFSEEPELFYEDCNKPLCVSVGEACETAGQLRNHGLRSAAFPFDWNITPAESLNKILESDFKFFLNVDCLLEYSNCMIHPKCWPHIVLNTYYNFFLVHDFIASKQVPIDQSNNTCPSVYFANDWKDDITRIKEKYIRRINRFHALTNYKGPVFFIQTFLNRSHSLIRKSTATRLRDLLRNKFPRLNFKLILIEPNEPEYKVDWGIEEIKHFYWYKGGPSYTEILNEIMKMIQ